MCSANFMAICCLDVGLCLVFKGKSRTCDLEEDKLVKDHLNTRETVNGNN